MKKALITPEIIKNYESKRGEGSLRSYKLQAVDFLGKKYKKVFPYFPDIHHQKILLLFVNKW